MAIFWGYNKSFKIFQYNNFNGKAENILHHFYEIKNCTYNSNLEVLISIDIKNNIIIWDPLSYKKK